MNLLVNGVMVEEEVKDESVSDGAKFETHWEEVNLRWKRIIGNHVPGAADYCLGV